MLAWLENSQASAWIRDEVWGWPVALTLHAFGTAVVVGFVLIVGLRVLGLFETIPYGSLSRLFPVVWTTFVLQFLTGFALWMTKPTQYVSDTAFALKMLFVVVGAILIRCLQKAVRHEGSVWETSGVSSRAIQFAAATVLIWCGVLLTGRLTAYLGSL
jgi:hypothetical protein